MATNGHIPREIMAKHLTQANSKRAFTESQDKHLQGCEACREMLRVLHETRKLSGLAESDLERDPSPAEISRYLEEIYTGALAQQQAARFYKQLLNSSGCYTSAFAIVSESFRPLTAADQEKLAAYSNLSIADNVLKAAPSIARPDILSRIWEILKKTGLLIIKGIDGILTIFTAHKPAPAMRLAFVVAIAMVLGGGWKGVIYWQDQAFWGQFRYDAKTPVPFQSDLQSGSLKSGGWRAGGGGQDFSIIDAFTKQFKYAVRDYDQLRYEQAIERLQALNGLAAVMTSAPADSQVLKLTRDYHFILGVSHLAVARSEKTNLPESMRKQHFEDAVVHLEEAQQISLANQMTDLDRDSFFLALAYVFNEQQSEAARIFSSIDVGSEYHKRSLELQAKIDKS